MPTKPEQIVEAMKILDEKLVSYLSGEENMSSKGKVVMIPELNGGANQCDDAGDVDVDTDTDDDRQMMMTPEEYRKEQSKVFESVNGMTINMEALTLENEGTQRMELLQTDIRPIFTVECQLSHELVEKVPRTEMFHMMHFESEKFQSTTQCTRFGQEATRQIHLSLHNDEDPYDKHFGGNKADEETTSGGTGAANLPNMGRIHFIVWWREPGTCLNEMLGMGILHLNQLYNANLLEQCKCIMIKRRNVHLANLYMKISLHAPPSAKKEAKLLQQQQKEIFGNSNNVMINPTRNLMINHPSNNICPMEHKNNVFCEVCSIKGNVLKQKLLNQNNVNINKNINMNMNLNKEKEKECGVVGGTANAPEAANEENSFKTSIKTGEYEAAARCYYYNSKDTKIQ